LKNLFGYVRYLLGQRWARRSLKGLVEDLRFEPEDESALAMWRAIDRNFDAIFHAMDFHLVSSATSGIMTPMLLGILAEGETPSEEHHVAVAALLAGAENVESADIAEGAERVLAALLEDRELCEVFVGLDDEAAIGWLRSDASGPGGRAFRGYLERHGHRAIKELELRQAEWRADPTPLVASLKVGARSRLEGGGEAVVQPAEAPCEAQKQGFVLRSLVRLAHQTVRSREETKSGLVAVTTGFKQAYRELARRMVDEALLPDDDAVFFLMHEELGRLVRGDASGLGARAIERRSVFDRQAALQFDDIFQGEPVPVVPELPEGMSERMLSGTAVSRGRIVGTARVVQTPLEAEALERGEILIAPITDVGWTPYFSLISGLVTDIGSAVSHGAVVAREFGLPAVVNTRFATQVFKTGDRVVLDADQGHVRIATALD